MMNTRFEISIKTILFTLAILAGAWLVIEIRDILFLLFIAFLLMTAIQPLVALLERVRIPRILGILLVYAVVFGFFGASLVGAIPALVVQSTKLSQEFPGFVARILPYWNIDVSTISQQIAPIGESVVKFTLGIFSNIVTVVTVLAFTFYFLMERQNAHDILKSIIGEAAARQSMVVLRAIEQRLGAWVRGELLLMTSIGALSFIGLSILHVDFALPLAILAGLLEVIPMVGPIASAIPAVLVALSVSPLLALSVAALYIVIQQFENNVLVPVIMKKSVGFAPIMTILALMIGGRLAGIMGAVLAIPIALVIQEIITSVLYKRPELPAPKPTKNPSKS
jgi:predicted PurR-regulated permease PerM